MVVWFTNKPPVVCDKMDGRWLGNDVYVQMLLPQIRVMCFRQARGVVCGKQFQNSQRMFGQCQKPEQQQRLITCQVVCLAKLRIPPIQWDNPETNLDWTKNIRILIVPIFFKQGAQKIALPYNPQQKLTVKQILSHFPSMDSSKSPKELYSADIQKDLLLLEEQEGSVNFKFGVIYMKSGQRVDDEMLSNGECFLCFNFLPWTWTLICGLNWAIWLITRNEEKFIRSSINPRECGC